MRKSKPEAGKQCPSCGQIENQVKMGYMDPKRREYPEETRALAIRMHHDGVSGREIGRALGMSKANVYNWLRQQGKE